MDEAESPRGRIALVQGLARGNLRHSPRLEAHLASCLECRACEIACPSRVAFGTLMDDARTLRNMRSGLVRRRMKQAWLGALSNIRSAHAISWLAEIYRASGLGSLVEGTIPTSGSRLRTYHRVVMQLDRPRKTSSATAGDPVEPGEIGLFLGCVARAAQPELSQAACRVLTRVGYRVRVPDDQCCCGAMYRHNGFPDQADRLRAQNVAAFADLQVVATASACAAELHAEPQLQASREICRFLSDIDWPREARLRPLNARVAVHQPCSHLNQLRDGNAACELLRRIPGIELVPLEANPSCCGAAGTYMLENSRMSASLLLPKISLLRQLDADLLVTTNTGCLLHLAAGVREAGLDHEVLHPIQLIDRQLIRAQPIDLRIRFQQA